MSDLLRDRSFVTLDQFIAHNEMNLPQATGEFSALLRDIGLAARIVNREVNRAGLASILGNTGQVNVQGEEVKKLDELANDLFIHTLKTGGLVGAIGSEENDDYMPINGSKGKYIVLMDPLDGSSNIDVNVSIGTIFSIYPRVSQTGSCTIEDCLQPGNRQLASGYVIYGSSTMLVYTTGNGVNGFTLEPSIGEFILSHPNIRLPEKCTYFSLNDRDCSRWEPGLQAYLNDVHARNCDEKGAFTPRYIGSMVADVHRNLLKGGIFIYPGTVKKPNGKLRLLYEGNPMAFLMEQAGGSATNGTERILDIQPTELHQRTAIFMGNAAEVERAKTFLLRVHA